MRNMRNRFAIRSGAGRDRRAWAQCVRHAVCAVALAVTVSGCSLHAVTGDLMADYATDHFIPEMMGYGDPTTACAAGMAFGPFLAGYSRVIDEPNAALVPTVLSAGLCDEMSAWEQNLRSARAIRAGKAAEAKDARVAEQRYRAAAARRFYEAYQRTERLFGKLDGQCPEFDSEHAELVFLLGMMGAVQGVANDRAAEGAVDIPLDVPRKAERGLKCLNNERWWHVPAAFRAAIWATVPGAAPEGVDPWSVIADAAEKGAAQGVRLAYAIYVQAAAGAGKEDRVRQAIAQQAASMAKVPAHAKWRTIDALARLESLAISDQLWTKAEGHRTPFGRFGELPGGATDAESDDEDDDLLDDEDLGLAEPPHNAAVAQRRPQ